MRDTCDAAGYLAVCLNPVIQKTLVFDSLAMGEVNRTSEHRVDAAGKGVCCARVLGQLGKRAVHLTQLGGPSRDWFLALCAADGVRVSWVESGSEIRFCTTLIDRADGSATELVEEARPVAPSAGGLALAAFERLLPEVGTVLLSGTKAAGFPASIMPDMARLAAAAGKRLFLDVKGADLVGCLPFRPVVAKPNLEELLQTYAPASVAAAREGRDEGAMRDLVARVGREYRDRHGTALVVTRGKRPILFWDGEALRECPVQPVVAINPIGSGDSFNVGIATALEAGATLAQAVAEGARLGALNAQRLKPGSIA
ncbi:MAG: PfkB family carbohydrate kinase [Spirochaetaceae bacterium]|nr:PfkB family carbohydrate kinase [Spirochaetaceae bacterium]